MKEFDWEARINEIITGLNQAKEHCKKEDIESGFDKVTRASLLLDILQRDMNKELLDFNERKI